MCDSNEHCDKLNSYRVMLYYFEHQQLFVGLLDPNWIERQKKTQMEKMVQDDVIAPGASIDTSLKQLAERRTDIFGVGVEETQIGKKVFSQ